MGLSEKDTDSGVVEKEGNKRQTKSNFANDGRTNPEKSIPKTFRSMT